MPPIDPGMDDQPEEGSNLTVSEALDTLGAPRSCPVHQLHGLTVHRLRFGCMARKACSVGIPGDRTVSDLGRFAFAYPGRTWRVASLLAH